ncbi:MAG TPA: malate dehydrogenase [Firmicutes bacterium]|nr:malate dehydrogenase [Bacillota bacterium]
MKPKIGIAGAGNVGATAAHICLMKNLGDIYLLDIDADMAKGKALDMSQSKFLFNSDIKISGGSDYRQLCESDYIIITAGLARKPGMSRDDLLIKNFEIMKGICTEIKNSGKDPFIIVVSNPLDIMTLTAFRITGFPENKVMGMAGVLDTYRLLNNIQEIRGAASENISSMILGGHGDTMVPLKTKTTINNSNVSDTLSQEEWGSVSDRAAKGGAEIVSLLKTGSAYYAPAASTVKMLDAIINDTGALLPCCVNAGGKYGINDIFIGLPVILDKTGVREIVEFELSPDEKESLIKSAQSIKEQAALIMDKF